MLAPAALELVAHGTTAIRSHVDVGDGIELRGLEALIEVREELRAEGLAELQLVALISPPTTGDAGAGMRQMVRDAMAMGADVVGGAPHIDPEPATATRELVALAAELGAPLICTSTRRFPLVRFGSATSRLRCPRPVSESPAPPLAIASRSACRPPSFNGRWPGRSR